MEREERRKINGERQLSAAKEALGLCQAELDAVQEELAAAHAQLRLRSIPEKEEGQGQEVVGVTGVAAREKEGALGEECGLGAMVGDGAKVCELTKINRELVELNHDLRKEVLSAAKSAAAQVTKHLCPLWCVQRS